jgi:hypothetical protein
MEHQKRVRQSISGVQVDVVLACYIAVPDRGPNGLVVCWQLGHRADLTTVKASRQVSLARQCGM